jgi:hypothetical protein
MVDEDLELIADLIDLIKWAKIRYGDVWELELMKLIGNCDGSKEEDC